MGIDDALDVFAVHGVGGMMGSILLAVFGVAGFGGFGEFEIGSQLLIQIKAVGFAVIWAGIATVLIAMVCKATVGLRIVDSVENQGLDQFEHGETAYNLE
jgi:Amt family ammonium transporter